MRISFGLPLLFVLASFSLRAQEWTRFRGPNGTGLSDAESIPATWTQSDVNWRVPLPGEGHSQPVIWGDRLFVTAAADEGRKRFVVALRCADGTTAWTTVYDSKTFKKHVRSSYASATPAVDEKRLYAVFSTPDSYALRALDHDGKELWFRDLGAFKSQHGDGASPIVHGELVVLANEQDGESFVVALDRSTGDVKWKSPRKSEEVAYATPSVLRAADGRESLVFSSHAHGISAVDPKTGALEWESPLFDKRTVSSPVIAGDVIVGTCGSGGGGNFLIAVRPGGKGDVSKSHLAYKLTAKIPYVPTSVYKDGLLFLWGDLGVVTCVEAPTGKTVWEKRVGGNYSGSPICVGDRLYALSEEGEAVVIAASREYALLGKTPLGEGSRSVPAVARGRLYLRTYSHLISVGGNKPPSASGRNQTGG